MSKTNIDKLYKIVYPIFQPGFCEGVVDLFKDTHVIMIIVNNDISKNKIEAIIESDFLPEKKLLLVEIDKI